MGNAKYKVIAAPYGKKDIEQVGDYDDWENDNDSANDNDWANDNDCANDNKEDKEEEDKS